MSTDTERGCSFDVAQLPKISLHDHLDGGLRPATILDLAHEIGHELPATDAERLRRWFIDAAGAGSLERYLETFEHTIAVMQTAPNLRRVAREFVEDLAADGIIYAEIRWAPEQHLGGGLSLDEAVEAVQNGIDAGIDAVEESGGQIEIGQILCAMRHANRGQDIAELAVRHRTSGVVGFDLAGAEAGYPPSKFTAAFTYLAEHNFPATVHAGEADGLASIQSALVDGRALRLGHGARLVEDLDIEFLPDEAGGEVGIVAPGELAAWVRDRGIALELCPSSNLQTGATAASGPTLAEHPFDLLYQSGFRVTINPDNRLMSGATLSSEMRQLVETFEYSRADLLQMMINAAQAAFAPLEVRDALIDTLTERYT